MEEGYSFNLDNRYRTLHSRNALSQMEALLKEQNLMGYIDGYLIAKGLFLVSKEDEDKKFYDTLYQIHEEEKNKNLSLPDLKALSREYINSYLKEKIQK
ncbi:MAG: hypothetical protein AABW90_01265 [Nanoarchaeota archaeon]